MDRALLVAALLLSSGWGRCQGELTFEPEDYSSPETAWGLDTSAADRWNLWTKDADAEKKWTGGKVLQSPQVMADRETPEDGAPVLHTVLTGIPDGAWVVTIKFGRDLGVSLDGKAWQRLSKLGGRLGRFEITGGKFEFWVDDRYAQAEGPGFSYYDQIVLTPSLPERNGVSNGGFEFGREFSGSGWSFWSREVGAGSAELMEGGRSGKRCAKFIHTGERDFALTNSGRLDVKPGQRWLASAWLKCEDTQSVDLSVVALGEGKLLTWTLAVAGIWDTQDWTRVEAVADVPPGCDQLYLRVVGSGKATLWADDVALEPAQPPTPPAPKRQVSGWAAERVAEKLGRGLVAMPLDGGRVYLGWRLLAGDPEGVAFNVYRTRGRALPEKLNAEPLTKTTDFTDGTPPDGAERTYSVRPVVGGREEAPSETVTVGPNAEAKPYVSIKLQGDHTFQKVGLGDLNGDGKLDYVLKQPQDNIDPYESYWQPSPDTYKLEAYLNDGTFLWRYDMGWAIERGIWYSPYLVYDLDGDGKAEVAVKSGEGDPRGPDGRVMTGPEYVSLLEGMTGKEKARADWPNRDVLGRSRSSYNYASRNQLGMAFLDGKTPCLLVARGTYTIMQVVAYQYHDGKLQELWKWDNREETVGNWRGQGAHWMHSGDVDGDGRDEVVLGSCVIDDNGTGLWTTGLGHPDRCFLTDVDPSRPGLEIFYNIEPGHAENGVCLADARTGDLVWGLKERTYHVGSGMAADVDPTHPGCECWAGEDGKGDPKGQNYGGAPPRWVLSATGEVLARDASAFSTFNAVYWDADGLQELCSGSQLRKWDGQVVTQGIAGSQVFWGDVVGDWREEILTTVPGELRIYTTTLPASDRHVCLLQDPSYRTDVAHEAMGYTQPPSLGYYLRQSGASLRLGSAAGSLRAGKTTKVTAVLTAPAGEPAEGTVKLNVPEGLSATPPSAPLSAPAGGTAEATFEISLQARPPLLSGGKTYTLGATLAGASPLAGATTIKAEEDVLTGVPIGQAEDLSDQGGGEVHLREDKVGAVGKAFSHWDNEGHWLSWQLDVPAAGEYLLVVRYCSPNSVQREVQMDDLPARKQTYAGTGGFGSSAGDWAHGAVVGDDGQPLLWTLKPGRHTIKMTNVDGRGMNVDYVALAPVRVAH